MSINFGPLPDMSPQMPIIKPAKNSLTSVPLAMLYPFREKAMLLYGRTLERIAEHRGLTAVEIMQLIRPEGWEPGNESCAAVLEGEVRCFRNWGTTKLQSMAAPLIQAVAASTKRVCELYNEAHAETKYDYSDCQPTQFKGEIAHLKYIRHVKSEESLNSVKARPFVLYMTIDGRAWSFERGVKVERTQEIQSAPSLDPRNFLTPATRKMVEHYEAIIADLSTKIDTLFDSIKHGDEDHQGWLKEALVCHFNGDPMPEYVAGKSKTEKAITDFFNNLVSEQKPLDADIAAVLEKNRSDLYAGEDIGVVEMVKRPIELKLLGWRIDWKAGSEIGLLRWCGADDWKTKDRLVGLGGVAVELWGDPAKAPTSGPSIWPVMGKEYQHYPDEPFFVLLGRDPQAPDLIEGWAKVREAAEPGDWKIAEARQTAQDMRMYKLGNPGVGMSIEAYKAANVAPNPVVVEEVMPGTAKVLAKIAEENPEGLPLALQLTDNKPCPTCNYHWAHCRCPKTEVERVGDVINNMPVGMGLSMPLGFESSEEMREYRAWQETGDANQSYFNQGHKEQRIVASNPAPQPFVGYNPIAPAPVTTYNPSPTPLQPNPSKRRRK